MPLTPEQVKELKGQLLSQVSKFPENQRAQAKAAIEAMSPEEVELMLKEQSGKGQKSNKGIFRMIVDHEIPAKIVDESPLALAVLDIKPISKGHVVIIPKKASGEVSALPIPLFSLAKKIGKRISTKLKAKSVEIQTELKFGEAIINIIPVYDSPVNVNSPRQDSNEKELEEIHKIIKAIKRNPIIRKSVKADTRIIHFPRRIP